MIGMHGHCSRCLDEIFCDGPSCPLHTPSEPTMPSPRLPAARSLVRLQSRQRPAHVHEPGTTGVIVGNPGPGVVLVELRAVDETLVGGAWYEVFELADHEYEIEGKINT